MKRGPDKADLVSAETKVRATSCFRMATKTVCLARDGPKGLGHTRTEGAQFADEISVTMVVVFIVWIVLRVINNMA